MKVTKVERSKCVPGEPDYYLIYMDDGLVYAQRASLASASDMPMTGTEELIISLAECALSLYAEKGKA